MSEEQSSIRYARVISYNEAHEIVESGLQAARSAGLAMSVTVVDSTQAPLAFGRESEAAPFTAQVALSKARTAVLLRTSTAALSDATQPGGDLWGLSTATDSAVTTFGGGIPLSSGGLVIGAIGVSGGTAREDEQIATAAKDAFDRLMKAAEPQ